MIENGKMKVVLLFTFMMLMINLSNAQEQLTWKVKHPKTNELLLLGQKGSVQELLINKGELPDPFVGNNEELFLWIEDVDWVFTSEFTISSTQKEKLIDIEFPAIDTYASIYLNDELIGHTENAFITYRFAINNKVKTGLNQLKVVFQSPVNYHKKKLSKESIHYPAPNDVGTIKVASLTRKPQYQFGWDWSIRMNTIGFWKPVKIITYQANRVITTNIQTKTLTKNEAIQSFGIQLIKNTNQPVIWKSKLFGTKEIIPKEGWINRDEIIQQPKLWWPLGEGEQALYNDHWIVELIDGTIIYEADRTFGIRTSELIQEKDQWGTSFFFKINSRPIFCKGANYIPSEVFPAKITAQQLKKSVETMAESNFNMIRVWGGGLYPDEAFFQACDSLGIMVWQDFMFACAMYPGDNVFFATVQEEVNQQIPRISSHPSVVYLNGNNEVAVAWKNWGFQSTYSLSKKEQQIIEKAYTDLFHGLLPVSIAQFTTLPYVHTSPLSNWGKDSLFNHGTQHYWGVWHGKDPLNDFAKKSGRFNAEFGFQSFPEYATLLTFSDTTDWYLTSPVMKQHQKSYVGNGMMKKHADLLFGESTDFKTFVYYSQLVQAEGVELAIVAHRLDYPRCGGTLYWQFNDCWPASTWSSIDYFGNWKALHYRVKTSFEPVAVLQAPLDSSTFFLVSDVSKAFTSNLSCSVYDLSGELLEQISTSIDLSTPVRMRLFENELAKWKNQSVLYQFAWTNHEYKQKTQSFRKLAVDFKSNKNLVPTIQVALENIDETNKKATLILETDTYLMDFWIYSLQQGVTFSNNFCDFLPGKHAIQISFESLPKLSDFQYQFR